MDGETTRTKEVCSTAHNKSVHTHTQRHRATLMDRAGFIARKRLDYQKYDSERSTWLISRTFLVGLLISALALHIKWRCRCRCYSYADGRFMIYRARLLQQALVVSEPPTTSSTTATSTSTSTSRIPQMIHCCTTHETRAWP